MCLYILYHISIYFIHVYTTVSPILSTKSKSQMPIRIRSRQPFGVRCYQLTSEQQQTSRTEPGSRGNSHNETIFYMWNDVWNDVRTTSSCEEQPVFGDSTTRPGGTGTIYCTFKTASKHAQHSAICWAARWNARATNRSLVPLLADLLGSKLERPESPTGLLFLYLQICWAASWNVQSHQHGRKRPNYVWS